MLPFDTSLTVKFANLFFVDDLYDPIHQVLRLHVAIRTAPSYKYR